MIEFKKIPTERSLLGQLVADQVVFPPFSFSDVHLGEERNNVEFDACLTLQWQNKAYRFGVVCKSSGTPRTVALAADEIKRTASLAQLNPLVLVPYLGRAQLNELESQGVSGIDLCGNGIVIVPGELLVYRTGSPNQFRTEGTIKNVYRKTSSIVGRLFLLKPEFGSVNEAVEQIRLRGGAITLPTVSKVCAKLEQDLILERGRGDTPTSRRLRLIQPEKLLDRLAENYQPPETSGILRGKINGSSSGFDDQLRSWESTKAGKVVLTGTSSVASYAVMARESVRNFYCTNLDDLRKHLGKNFHETERFADVVFRETQDDLPYFDRREGFVASPIQTYLELVSGEKRERETAEQVRRVILDGVKEIPPKE